MTDGSELAIALRAAYLALHRRSEGAFAPHGVTADQFVLLASLSRGNALTQRDLARRGRRTGTLSLFRGRNMTHRPVALLAWVVLAGLTLPAAGQKDDPPKPAAKAEAPPADFDKKQDNIERGKLETVEYESKSVG